MAGFFNVDWLAMVLQVWLSLEHQKLQEKKHGSKVQILDFPL